MPRNRRIAARSPGRVLEFGMFGALFLASVLAPAMLASVQPASGQASTIQNIGEALRASNYTAALQLIEPALRESPNDPRLWSMQGMALSGLRRAPEALASYKHALKISPDYLPALEGAAQIEYEADNKNAIPLLQQILRARPDDATSHAMLGTMDYKRGNCRDAVLHFDRSQSVLQSQPLALQQYGSCLAKVDRVDEAVAVFQKLVESNPTDAASRRRLAALQLTARRPKDAMATLQPLLLIDPPDPRVAELACAAYEADGNTPEGVSVLNRAVAANPRDIDLYVDLALLALDHHSFASGIEVMTSGLQVLPQAGPLYLERGILYVQLGEYAKAEADFAKAGELDPGQSVSEIARGKLAEQNGNLKEALETIERELRKKPNDAFLLYMRAEILVQQGVKPGSPQFHLALQSARQAVSRQPQMILARNLLGTLYMSKGDFQAAAEESRQVLKIDPGNESALYHLILALRRQGDEGELPALLKRLAQLHEAANKAAGPRIPAGETPDAPH
jgi:tetratricopeptide (TPR) repeat protein